MIHPTAIVHPNAELDIGVEVGPWSLVGPHVKIGKNTKLMSHVVVDGWTRLGEGNTVFPFSVIGGMPQDLKYKGEPTEVIIGDRNTIRESVTINLGTVGGGGKTTVGDDTLLMAYVHLGHDCRVGSRVIVANNTGLAGHVSVGDYANIGGQVGVIQFCNIGAHSYVTGQAGVEKDIPPFVIAMGSRPCVVRGANIVGMRRRGIPTETITRINDAIKLWGRPEVPKEQALLEIESQYGEIAEVKEFIRFIRASEVGVIR